MPGVSTRRSRTRWPCALLAAAWLALPFTATADAVLDQAADLLARGDDTAAYELLAARQPERAGEPAFDRLMGAAARATGRPAEAIFALERVLELQPGDQPARAELVQAYIDIGDFASARREVDRMRGLPAASGADQARAARLAAAINAAQSEVSGYLAVTVGWDDNINSSPDSLAAPGGFVLAVPDRSLLVETDDFFGKLSGGIEYSRPLTASVRFRARGRFFARLNASEDEFDTGAGSARAGLEWRHGSHRLSADGFGQSLFVDGERFRDAIGVVGRWRYGVGSRGRVTGTLSASRLNYDDQTIRNADRLVGGISYLHRFPAWNNAAVNFGAFIGTEEETNPGVKHLGFDLHGFNLGAGMEVRRDLSVLALLQYEARDYGGVEPTFQRSREDERWNVRLRADYQPLGDWTVSPEYVYSSVDSSIPVNEYDRNTLQLTFRRDF